MSIQPRISSKFLRLDLAAEIVLVMGFHDFLSRCNVRPYIAYNIQEKQGETQVIHALLSGENSYESH